MKEDRGLSPIHCFITFLGFDCVEHCFDCMLTTENGVFTKKNPKNREISWNINQKSWNIGKNQEKSAHSTYSLNYPIDGHWYPIFPEVLIHVSIWPFTVLTASLILGNGTAPKLLSLSAKTFHPPRSPLPSRNTKENFFSSTGLTEHSRNLPTLLLCRSSL